MFEDVILNVLFYVSFALSAALFLVFLIVHFMDAFKKIMRGR